MFCCGARLCQRWDLSSEGTLGPQCPPAPRLHWWDRMGPHCQPILSLHIQLHLPPAIRGSSSGPVCQKGEKPSRAPSEEQTAKN